jgi:hypothetical protein
MLSLRASNIAKHAAKHTPMIVVTSSTSLETKVGKTPAKINIRD